MLDRIASGEWPAVLFNMVLLTLWGALPLLLIAYVRQSLAMRRIRPEFCLRKSEAAELDRALALYRDVGARLAEIEAQSRTTKGILHLIFALQPDIERRGEEEREDLDAHARHLRATIAKLRGLPLGRLQERIAALSFHYAVGAAVAVYVAIFGILVFTFFVPGVRAAARELAQTGHSALVWYPFDGSYFLANGAGAALGVLLAPAFYLLRRIVLVREYAMEITVLKELAETPADVIVDEPAAEADDTEDFGQSEPTMEESCFAILGVERSASIEQVRAAYRTRIKQSHPDRLHDISPAIRAFAEDETKRLNAALQEALERLA